MQQASIGACGGLPMEATVAVALPKGPLQLPAESGTGPGSGWSCVFPALGAKDHPQYFLLELQA